VGAVRYNWKLVFISGDSGLLELEIGGKAYLPGYLTGRRTFHRGRIIMSLSLSQP
jgi:hypothetical protein